MWKVVIAVFGLWHELIEERGFQWWGGYLLIQFNLPVGRWVGAGKIRGGRPQIHI